MAGPTLDGAGVQKMKTIDEANTQVQRLHGVVETYALALKRNQPTQLFSMQVKRAITPLVGLLKPQTRWRRSIWWRGAAATSRPRCASCAKESAP
jgi:hypothetical protein